MTRLNKIYSDILPICFVCKKEVESVQYQTDWVSMNYYFTAHCHGEIDQVKINQDGKQMLENSAHIERGFAFLPKKQIDETKRIEHV